MSEYKIVNRVHPTPAFAQTVAEVEAQAELDKSLPLVQEVAQNPEVAKVLRKKGFNVVSYDCAEEDVDNAFKFLEVPKPSAVGVEAMLQKQFGPGSEHCCGNELAEEMKTAEASRAPFVGKTEEWQPEEGPLVIAFETPESGEVITREEFEQLKADLVLAFKKMGFDVSL